jgi:hypothetical protein
MGCNCKFCKHVISVECQSANCKCCSEANHKLDIMISNDKEIDDMLSIKYPDVENR